MFCEGQIHHLQGRAKVPVCTGEPTKIVLSVHGAFSHLSDGNRIGARRLLAPSSDSSGTAGPTLMNTARAFVV